MALVCVHGPLRKLAGGCAELQIGGATVEELLRGLEREYPAVTGWILDERGSVRRHINVFVNGERVDQGTAVAANDRVEVLPAITGGT
ncbi:MAG TPA: MoaD/ThiS family protein [Solirubrobacteraceae bacterium]|nr:MoaD/ThiS family protein [Solirubrobacteraceae bacterium]